MAYLACTATIGINFVLTEPLLLASQPLLATPRMTATYTLPNGLVAVADAIDDHFEDVDRVLAASASRTYILSALTDTLPRSIVFTGIKVFIIHVTSRTAGDHLSYGPGNTHGWTALVPASNTQACYATTLINVDKTDTLAVTSGSNDQLVITNSGSNPITFSLFLAGNSG